MNNKAREKRCKKVNYRTSVGQGRLSYLHSSCLGADFRYKLFFSVFEAWSEEKIVYPQIIVNTH